MLLSGEHLYLLIEKLITLHIEYKMQGIFFKSSEQKNLQTFPLSRRRDTFEVTEIEREDH